MRPLGNVRSESSNPGVANGPPRRNFKINAAEWLENIANCFYKLRTRSYRFVSVRSVQFDSQNFARLLLHGPAMLGGTDPQLALGALGQLTDGNAGHAINDITAINDCNAPNSAGAHGIMLPMNLQTSFAWLIIVQFIVVVSHDWLEIPGWIRGSQVHGCGSSGLNVTLVGEVLPFRGEGTVNNYRATFLS